MKRKLSLLCIIMLIILFAGVSVTLAYLVASSRTVTNTFTAGNIEITLTETSGDTYKMIPGTTVHKNPRVTVKGGSDACWLFFELEESVRFDDYVTYEIEDGWFALEDVEHVYYRQVEDSDYDVSIALLKNDVVTIRDTVTEEQLAEIDENQEQPFLEFRAYAIQMEGNENAQLAWKNLQTEEGVSR